MLTQLRLTRYKGFRAFTANLKDHSLLLGPNNAGKSTIINALRLGGAAAKVLMRLRATEVFRDLDRNILGHPLASVPDDGYDFGNIAHEFQAGESRLELKFSTGAIVRIVWPEDDPPFFWLSVNEANVTTAAGAKQALIRVGLVPTLTPVDRHEKLLSREHLAANIETKLASRHFRNNLHGLQRDDPTGYSEFIGFACERTPEISTLEVELSSRDNGAYLDLFYRHPDSRVRKEIVWAGDGLQIWLQILFHLWRTREQRSVVLDEPDVFLHPDLQRRLIRVVEERTGQTIVASHSAEVAGEASSSSLIWIDRSRKTSRAVSDDLQMEQLSAVLGSSFNLSIAKALRARTALFVEGDDMKVLRILAKKAGAPKLSAELGVAIVPIGGFSHWPSVEAFSWLKTKFLGRSVKVRVLLDRDYRSAAESKRLTEKLAEAEVFAHVWARKEIESYLLVPGAVQRVSGLDEATTLAELNRIADLKRSDVFGQFQKAMFVRRPEGEDQATTFSRAATEFEGLWTDVTAKMSISPAKAIISGWNASAVDTGAKPISATKLAQAIKLSELDPEVVSYLTEVESDL